MARRDRRRARADAQHPPLRDQAGGGRLRHGSRQAPGPLPRRARLPRAPHGAGARRLARALGARADRRARGDGRQQPRGEHEAGRRRGLPVPPGRRGGRRAGTRHRRRLVQQQPRHARGGEAVRPAAEARDGRPLGAAGGRGAGDRARTALPGARGRAAPARWRRGLHPAARRRARADGRRPRRGARLRRPGLDRRHGRRRRQGGDAGPRGRGCGRGGGRRSGRGPSA